MGKTRISIDCIDQRLLVVNDPLLASGGQNEDEVVFSFCPLWEGFGKTAVFYRNLEDVYNVPVVSDKCIIPAEVLTEKGEFYFGVFGTNGDATRTSEVIKYTVVQGAAIPGSAPSDPTPDIYSQILSKLGDIEQLAVKRTGDNFSGKLIMGNGSAVRNGENGWVSFGFATNDGVSRGDTMLTDTNVWHVNVKQTGAQYADRYMLPKPTEGKTEDTWYSILTSKTPVTLAQGGTGVAELTALVELILNSFTAQPSSMSEVDVFSLPPGIYHCEAETSTACNYPIAKSRATVEIIGQYRDAQIADDSYPLGYWFIRITYSNGDMYINYRQWNKWLGWKQYTGVSVTEAAE